jgi:hypothetical protein
LRWVRTGLLTSGGKILFSTYFILTGIDINELYIPLIGKMEEAFLENEVAEVFGLNYQSIFNIPGS